MTATTRSADDVRLGIGKVLERLQEEFPDLTLSKIRYLESQGLVRPGRSASGYRQFTQSDLTRLVWILRQQREYFLPLRVIREILDRAGGVVPPPESEAGESQTKADQERMVGSVSMTLEELAATLGVVPDVVAGLEHHGLVVAQSAGRTRVYDESALLAARLAVRLLSLGLDVRHLRMYLIAAQREAGVLEQLLVARVASGDSASRESAQHDLEEVVEAGSRLHHLLLRRSLTGLNR